MFVCVCVRQKGGLVDQEMYVMQIQQLPKKALVGNFRYCLCAQPDYPICIATVLHV